MHKDRLLEQMEILFDKKFEELYRKLFGNSHNDNLEDDDLISMKDVCVFLEVSRPTVYSWMNKGKIEPHRKGKQLYFSKEKLKLFKASYFLCRS